MSRRVAIVGQGLVTAFGETWEDNRTKILECQNAVRHMQEWEIVLVVVVETQCLSRYLLSLSLSNVTFGIS